MLLTLALWPLFHYLLWLDSTATVPSPDPSWIAYQKANEIFAERVAQVYRPGDLVIVHDYHLLLTPKLIRDKLSLALGLSGHLASAAPSPAIGSPSLAAQQQQKGMDWGNQGSQGLLGAVLKSANNLGDNLKAVTGNGNSAGGNQHHHHPHNEVMIGLFIHTPWPSSEIFRCLPSE